jgi:hypothetical protein
MAQSKYENNVVPFVHGRAERRHRARRKGSSPPSVTIFGAGIAGMTAAHELVERGFQVEVWEPEDDERAPSRDCAIGGMARTQWSAVPWPEEFTDVPCGDFANSQATPIEPIDAEIYVKDVPDYTVSLSLVPDYEGPSLQASLLKAGEQGSCVYAECLFTANAPEKTNAQRDERAKRLVPEVMAGLGFLPDWEDEFLKLSNDDGSCGLLVRAFECPPGEGFPRDTQVLIRFRKRER